MTSFLAGTLDHGVRGSGAHCNRPSPGLSGTPLYSPELPGSGSHNTLLEITCCGSIIMICSDRETFCA